MPATNDLRIHFDTDLTVINATIALFVLAIGVAPLFWAPFSERIGRRWVYISSMGFYTVFTIICGIANSLPLFFVFRILQGIASSAGMAVGGGSVADLFRPAERGRAMSTFMLGTIIGPAFSPLIGGYVAQYLGWRWIFYICTILGGVIFIANIVLLRETLYRPNYEKPKSRIEYLKFNPFTSLRLLLRPEVLLVCIPISTAFGWFYYLVTILPSTYSEVYGFDTGTIGLLYLAGGVGNCSGSVIAGFISDRIYAYQLKHGKTSTEGRLVPLYFGIPFLIAGFLMYGWFVHSRLHWFTPLIGYMFSTLGSMYTITTGTTYLVESYLHVSASVVSVSNFTRNLFAMLFSILSVQIRAGMGDNWSYTLASLMNLVFYLICIPMVHIFGARLRAAKPWYSRKQVSN
ncbi:major facilitator superfamily domain-containing protein [Phascolomyces articulosus]|uniref:Major facilitator superfamily domain-containing protein n=1 Tax=Phascolomyces articulosus TaxID=60185 RepID=A0AAD5K8Q2_9FUNG|nr:major facilitator superfamily domain-containing protein [Phascolomyces articulosus]